MMLLLSPPIFPNNLTILNCSAARVFSDDNSSTNAEDKDEGEEYPRFVVDVFDLLDRVGISFSLLGSLSSSCYRIWYE